MKQILTHVQPGEWFILVDLKDAYSHRQVCRWHVINHLELMTV